MSDKKEKGLGYERRGIIALLVVMIMLSGTLVFGEFSSRGNHPDNVDPVAMVPPENLQVGVHVIKTGNEVLLDCNRSVSGADKVQLNLLFHDVNTSYGCVVPDEDMMY